TGRTPIGGPTGCKKGLAARARRREAVLAAAPPGGELGLAANRDKVAPKRMGQVGLMRIRCRWAPGEFGLVQDKRLPSLGPGRSRGQHLSQAHRGLLEWRRWLAPCAR